MGGVGVGEVLLLMEEMKMEPNQWVKQNLFVLKFKGSSLHFKMVSMPWKKPIHTQLCLSEMSLVLLFETHPMFLSLMRALWRKIIKHFLFICLSPPADQWRALVSHIRSQAPQHTRASKMQATCDFCLWVYLLGHFPWFRHVQGSIYIYTYIHTQESLKVEAEHWHIPFKGFPFHFLLLTSKPVNQWYCATLEVATVLVIQSW